jgi:hypothetical protein
VPGLDVRQLAAVDMVGGGSRWRRWVILVEFVAGCAGCLAIAVVLLLGAGSWLGVGIGLWFAGVGLNYLPLAVHAVTLARPGALDRELAGVDVRARLRHYTLAQFWVFVPLALVVFALRRRAGLRGA